MTAFPLSPIFHFASHWCEGRAFSFRLAMDLIRNQTQFMLLVLPQICQKKQNRKRLCKVPIFFGWEENFPARLCRRCVRYNVCVCVCVRALFQFQWFSYFASRCGGWERQESERFCSVFELIAVFRTYDFFMNRWGDFHQWKSARWRWLEGGRGEIVMTSNFDGCYANPTIFSCH